MNHQENIRDQLSAYLDGELSPEQARRVEQALSQDPALAGELAALRATRELLRKLPQQHAGDDFAARVLDRAERLRLIGQVHAGAAKRAIRWSSLATAAAVFIAAGAGIYMTVKLTSVETFPAKAKVPKNGGPIQVAEAPSEDRTHPPAVARGKELALAGRKKEEATEEFMRREAAGGRIVTGAPVEGAKEADKRGVSLARAFTAPQQASRAYEAAFGANAGDWSNAANVVIYTDDLPAARQQVERLLACNAITNQLIPVVETHLRAAPMSAGVASSPSAASAPTGPQMNQVQIVALVPSRQMEQLQNELLAIRANQGRSQEAAGLPQARYYVAPSPRGLPQAPTSAGAAKGMEGKEVAEALARRTAARPAGTGPEPMGAPMPLPETEKAQVRETPGEAVEEPTSQPAEELKPLVITVNLATPTTATAPSSQPASGPATQPAGDSPEPELPNDESD